MRQIITAPVQGEPEEDDNEEIQPQVQLEIIEMVSDVESVVTGPHELGEYDNMNNAEIEPQVGGLEDREARMDEPQAKPKEQKDTEEPLGGFMFGDDPQNAWWVDN